MKNNNLDQIKNDSTPPPKKPSWQRQLLHTKSGRYFSFGCLGAVGFPFYYFIWAHLFPQPYENLNLRLIGALLCVPLLFSIKIGEKPILDFYFYAIVVTYAFPFFFTFMFLMNDGSSVWAQSVVIMFAILFSFDAKIAIPSLLMGIAGGYGTYVFTTNSYQIEHWRNIMTMLPMLIFSITTSCIIKIGRQVSTEEKLGALAAGISTAAHELRNPLAAIVGYIGAIEKYTLRTINKINKNEEEENKERIKKIISLVNNQIYYSNSMINILVTNAWKGKNKIQSTKIFSIKNIIYEAVQLYPYFNEQQKNSVHIKTQGNFDISGDERLFILIIHNLIKNSFKAISSKNGRLANITISTFMDENNIGHMIFEDNGCGIPKKNMPFLFKQFFSYPANSGTGIGLAFCRDVLNEWGATIQCQSEENAYTRFIIKFPPGNKMTSKLIYA